MNMLAMVLLLLVCSLALLAYLTRKSWHIVLGKLPEAIPAIPDAVHAPLPADGRNEKLYFYAAALEEFYHQSSYPSDFLTQDAFLSGVKLLSGAEYGLADLLSFTTGANVIVSCMALQALMERPDEADFREHLLENINDDSYWRRYFSLHLLNKKVDGPLIGPVLCKTNQTWADPVPLRILREFLDARLEKDEELTLGNHLEGLDEEGLEELTGIIRTLGPAYREKLLEEVQAWSEARVDVDFLSTFGRIWFERESSGPAVLIEHKRILETISEVERSLVEERSRSVVLVGEDGVGKTTALRLLGKKLHQQGWTLFECSANDLLAGQVYIGQLEERLQQLVRKIGGKRKVVWIIPNFHELAWAGSHKHSPTGVLDMIFPFVEVGEILLIGETQPLAYERLLQHFPRMRVAINVVEVNALPQEETIELTREWIKRRNTHQLAVLPDNVIKEAFQLTQQYLGDRSAPGNLLLFLDQTWERLNIDKLPREVTTDDLLVTLSKLTGLPKSILDEREGLDLTALGDYFRHRVKGQPEAIDTLVERVAMIKAGLNDPTRPQGVFLFAGPTGTGKTEIAKTLAEFLFGSDQRMIRLDMSEFKTPESIDRLLGANEDFARSEALVNLIRKQPFSVVLLDEVEKAYPDVWDLFLQVFDDGRLTDRRGNTSDFRHCIIMMTSNLGGVIPRGASIGFTSTNSDFTSSGVSRALDIAFRKEFLNRIDRVVVFRPLSRAVMRDILRKELADVLKRRGFRNRAWAVEWHESAIEYLLDKGFTADLGARPLKRAIEQYLLSPLALTIVNHQFPEGDQFLFVRSNGRRIEVEFIDPDAPDGVAAGEPKAEPKNLSLQSIILDPRVHPAEVELLREHFRRIGQQLESETWSNNKQQALAATSTPGFWDDPQRFSLLGLVEYMDRIETGFKTAARLMERLVGPEGDRAQYSAPLLSQLAHQLYLLEAAQEGLQMGIPNDAFILVEAGRDSGVDELLQDEFAGQIGQMYVRWAEKRRMRHKTLLETGGDGNSPYRLMLAVSGYAAYAILLKEAGLHVLEVPAGGKSFKRAKVHVHVVAQPEEPAGNEKGALYKQAQDSFYNAGGDEKLAIVRRYREEPSPLVRDSVRNWRTGRMDRVLAGDFDLIT